MEWGKIILIFQAIVTLIIGIVFFTQVFNIEYNFEEEVQEDYKDGSVNSIIVYEQLIKYEEFKKRFFTASYILVLISIIELILIWRLLRVSFNDAEFEFGKDFSFS